MSNQPRPQSFDVVLGDSSPPPTQGAVLGGASYLRRVFENGSPEERMTAVERAPEYGEAGTEVLLDEIRLETQRIKDKFVQLQEFSEQSEEYKETLLRQLDKIDGLQNFGFWFGDEKRLEINQLDEIRLSAAHMLWRHGTDQAMPFLNQYRFYKEEVDYFPFYHHIKYWAKSSRGIHVGDGMWKKDPPLEFSLLEKFINGESTAQSHNISCCIYDKKDRRKAFTTVVQRLAQAKKKLPLLQSLFIGDAHNYSRDRYTYRSRVGLGNIYPILKAYPKLEVLRIRGWAKANSSVLKRDLEVVSLKDKNGQQHQPQVSVRHDSLKALIVETCDLQDFHLQQLCTLRSNSLEYLEIWLRGKQLTKKGILKSLEPILNDEAFPNLTYLGLPCCQYGSAVERAISTSSLFSHLRIIDLSKGDGLGKEALEKSPYFHRLHTLNLDDESERYYSSVE